VLAEIRTRLKEWMLVPVKNAALAVKQLEQRTQARDAQGSRAQLGVLAVRAFWSNLWDGVALHNAEPQPAPLPWLLATA
jgi:hypothetical protein